MHARRPLRPTVRYSRGATGERVSITETAPLQFPFPVSVLTGDVFNGAPPLDVLRKGPLKVGIRLDFDGRGDTQSDYDLIGECILPDTNTNFVVELRPRGIEVERDMLGWVVCDWVS